MTPLVAPSPRLLARRPRSPIPEFAAEDSTTSSETEGLKQHAPMVASVSVQLLTAEQRAVKSKKAFVCASRPPGSHLRPRHVFVKSAARTSCSAMHYRLFAREPHAGCGFTRVLPSYCLHLSKRRKGLQRDTTTRRWPPRNNVQPRRIVLQCAVESAPTLSF